MKINILSLPRTGSSYFFNLLSQNLFFVDNRDKTTIPEPFSIESMRSKNHKKRLLPLMSKEYIIFKNHVDQLDNLRKNHSKLYDVFAQIEWYTIVLLRKNLFNSVMSSLISKITSQYDDYSYDETLRIVLSYEKMVLAVDAYFYWWTLVANNSFNLPYKKILYYEDFSFNSENDFNMLNMENATFKTHVVTLKSPNKEVIIKNYDEIYRLYQEYILTKHDPNIIVEKGWLRLKNEF